MAPITRAKARLLTPERPIREGECTTVQKSAYFYDYDHKPPSKTDATLAKEHGIHPATARRWRAERRQIGSPANRRSRPRSTLLGRVSKVSKETCQKLVSPKRNPVRDQMYEAQLEYHHIPVEKRQLQRRLRAETQGGRRYK